MSFVDDINNKFEKLSKIQRLYNEIISDHNSALDENILETLRTFESGISKVLYNFEQELESFKDDEFKLKIGVVGSFNSGKSTFLNSLIGDNLLKMDATPSTAMVSLIQYGDNLEIFKKFKDNSQVPITKEEFDADSNHYESPAIATNDIDHFIIKYPSDVLKRFVFVDTPGLSSVQLIDDEKSMHWIPKFDVIIWLIGPSKGGMDENQRKVFLTTVGKESFAILNRIDEKPPNAIKKIKEELEKDFENVFLYIAKDVLQTRLDEVSLIKKFESLINKVREDFWSRRSFTLKHEIPSICYKSNDANEVIDSNHRQTPGDYYNNIISHLNKVREGREGIKRKAIEKELSFSIEHQQQKIQELITDLKRRVIQNDKRYMQISDECAKVNSGLVKILEKGHSSLRTNLFSEIFDLLFEKTTLSEGNQIWGDKVIGFSRKFTDNDGVPDEVVAKVLSSFKGLTDSMFKSLDFNMNNQSLKSDYPVEVGLIDTVRQNLSESIKDSFKVYFRLYSPKHKNLEDEKEKIKTDIDLLIPDELFKDLLVEVGQRIVKKSYELKRSTIARRTELLNSITQKLEHLLYEINS